MRRTRSTTAVAVGFAAALTAALVGSAPAAAATCPELYPPAREGLPGDLNGDGHADAVVGEPGRADAAGAFRVLYGHVDGLVADQTDTARGDRLISRATDGVEGAADPGDELGAAVVLGDFDLDGCADVAVGAPGDAGDAGSVSVFYGSPGTGLRTAGDQLFGQDTPGVPGAGEAGDRFGTALAAGDFNDDDYPDLAVGAPGEDLAGRADAGAVWIIYGDDEGLGRGPGTVMRTEDTAGVPSESERGDRFGAALAAADVTGDGSDELAVGTPGEDGDRGAVTVLYGSENELHGDGGAQRFDQDTVPVAGVAEPGDEFGAAVAMGHFNAGARGGRGVHLRRVEQPRVQRLHEPGVACGLRRRAGRARAARAAGPGRGRHRGRLSFSSRRSR